MRDRRGVRGAVQDVKAENDPARRSRIAAVAALAAKDRADAPELSSGRDGADRGKRSARGCSARRLRPAHARRRGGEEAAFSGPRRAIGGRGAFGARGVGAGAACG